jgi:hypothetical protein
VAREAPYITIEAESPLDSRWTATLHFAWMRLLGTCRLKRACTAETWPAAVLELRFREAASILDVPANRVRYTLDTLSTVASITVRYSSDHGGDTVSVSVDNYAKYQKLGRPTSAITSKDVSDPPSVPTSLRKKKNSEEEPPLARRTRSDPVAWAQMFAKEPDAAEAVAFVTDVLPDIEGRADAQFPNVDPSSKAWNGAVRSWLWRYWRNRGRDRPTGVAARANDRARLMADNAREAMRLAEARENADRERRASGRTDPDVRRLRAGSDPIAH